jgi:hypothetical protein
MFEHQLVPKAFTMGFLELYPRYIVDVVCHLRKRELLYITTSILMNKAHTYSEMNFGQNNWATKSWCVCN